ncbi:MAG: peroxide stress protein YaaA [Rikenellaceae bacterium]
MIALISPAKGMSDGVEPIAELHSLPRFTEHTELIAREMRRYSTEELIEVFRVSRTIAEELCVRFQNFFNDESTLLPAVECYDGVVYKRFKKAAANHQYLQSRVRISSLMYGLLRPYDLIRPYRMEGYVWLIGSGERIDNYWRNKQTETLINDVKAIGGTLLYLASKEEQNSFVWHDVTSAVRVIDFKFLQNKGGKLKQVVVYTKMARGEMIRYMIENEITEPDDLKAFEWEGYTYRPDLSTPNEWVWVVM